MAERSADREPPAPERARQRIRATAHRVQAAEAEEAIARLRAHPEVDVSAADVEVVRALAERLAQRLVAVPDAHLAQTRDDDVARTAMLLFGRDREHGADGPD